MGVLCLHVEYGLFSLYRWLGILTFAASRFPSRDLSGPAVCPEQGVRSAQSSWVLRCLFLSYLCYSWSLLEGLAHT